jgi:tetratricopeptide (TPR) repeat protein
MRFLLSWVLTLFSFLFITIVNGQFDEKIDSALYYFENGQSAKAMNLYDEALVLTKNKSTKHFKGLKGKVLILESMGLYQEAISIMKTYQDNAEELKNDSLKFEARQTLGWLYLDLLNFKKALIELRECTKLASKLKDNKSIRSNYNDFGGYYLMVGPQDSAIHYFRKSLNMVDKYEDPLLYAKKLSNLASVLPSSDNDEMIDMFKESIDIIKKKGGAKDLMITMSSMAKTFVERIEDPKEIRLHLGKIGYRSIQEFENELDSLRITSNEVYNGIAILRSLILLQKFDGRIEDSYKSLIKYDSVKSSIYNRSLINSLAKLEYEKSLSILEHEKLIVQQKFDKEQVKNLELSWSRNKGYLILSLLISILIISFLIAYVFYRKKQLLLSQESIRSKELLKARMVELMNFKGKIIEKNRLIDQLETTIQNQSNLELHTIEIRINELKKMKILTEEDWREFKDSFSKAFPGWVLNIKSKNPHLTAGDLRTYMLIKLDLSNSEIAAVLGISSESAKKNRYRLKRKLRSQEDI